MSLPPKIKLLFVSHDDTLTGAPILLLNLLECLVDKWIVSLILKLKTGQLFEKFKKSGEVYCWKEETTVSKGELFRLFRLPLNIIKFRIRKIQIQSLINKTDILFLNTITQGDFINAFTIPSHVKVISYIHELEIATRTYSRPELVTIQIERSNLFLSPSVAVKSFLIERFNIPKQKIYPLNYYIPHEGSDLNSILAIPFTIGMIGTLDWRKGADLVPLFLRNYFINEPSSLVRFIWKGVEPGSIGLMRIERELSILGLRDKIEFLPSNSNTSSFYNQINALVLLSKEDPYPLVVLEAAQYYKPTICFEFSGGSPEFVKEDAGYIIPYLDLDSLSKTVKYLEDNPMIAQEKGKIAHQRYLELHADKSLIQDQFIEALNKVYESN